MNKKNHVNNMVGEIKMLRLDGYEDIYYDSQKDRYIELCKECAIFDCSIEEIREQRIYLDEEIVETLSDGLYEKY